MLKNITLSADETLIKKARKKALQRNTTVNKEFRLWLRRFTEKEDNLTGFKALMKKLENVESGGPFSRDELNER